ncbi:MAG: hypothetical protein AAFQ82_08685, partial [Myxococcota bacterium]
SRLDLSPFETLLGGFESPDALYDAAEGPDGQLIDGLLVHFDQELASRLTGSFPENTATLSSAELARVLESFASEADALLQEIAGQPEEFAAARGVLADALDLRVELALDEALAEHPLFQGPQSKWHVLAERFGLAPGLDVRDLSEGPSDAQLAASPVSNYFVAVEAQDYAAPSRVASLAAQLFPGQEVPTRYFGTQADGGRNLGTNVYGVPILFEPFIAQTAVETGADEGRLRDRIASNEVAHEMFFEEFGHSVNTTSLTSFEGVEVDGHAVNELISDLFDAASPDGAIFGNAFASPEAYPLSRAVTRSYLIEQGIPEGVLRTSRELIEGDRFVARLAGLLNLDVQALRDGLHVRMTAVAEGYLAELRD